MAKRKHPSPSESQPDASAARGHQGPCDGGVESQRPMVARSRHRKSVLDDKPHVKIVDIVVEAVKNLSSQMGVSIKDIECFTDANGSVPSRRGSRDLLRYGAMRALHKGCLKRTPGGLFQLPQDSERFLEEALKIYVPDVAPSDSSPDSSIFLLGEANVKVKMESTDSCHPIGSEEVINAGSSGVISVGGSSNGVGLVGTGGQGTEGGAKNKADKEWGRESPPRHDNDLLDDDDLLEGDMEYPEKRFAPQSSRCQEDTAGSSTERSKDSDHGRAAAAALFILASDIMKIISHNASVKLSNVREEEDKDANNRESGRSGGGGSGSGERGAGGSGGGGGGVSGGGGFKGPHIDYLATGGEPWGDQPSESAAAGITPPAMDLGHVVLQATSTLSEIVRHLSRGAVRVLNVSSSKGPNSESVELKEAIFQAFKIAAMDIVLTARGFVDTKQDGVGGDENDLGGSRGPNAYGNPTSDGNVLISGVESDPRLSLSGGGTASYSSVCPDIMALGRSNCPSTTHLSICQPVRRALSWEHMPQDMQPSMEELLQGFMDEVLGLAQKAGSNVLD